MFFLRAVVLVTHFDSALTTFTILSFIYCVLNCRYPEKIPFRLTRMLVNAMEVSGIEGNYRSVCEVVMVVLREQRDSVMAMLEAFVHDPLVNWGLFPECEACGGNIDEDDNRYLDVHVGSGSGYGLPENVRPKSSIRTPVAAMLNASEQRSTERHPDSSLLAKPVGIAADSMRRIKRASKRLSTMGGIQLPTGRDAILNGDDDLALALSTSGVAYSLYSRSKRAVLGKHIQQAGASRKPRKLSQPQRSSTLLNQKAVTVMVRVRDKLTGRDFSSTAPLETSTQVQRLIMQAMNHDNLSQCYIGWCPFW